MPPELVLVWPAKPEVKDAKKTEDTTPAPPVDTSFMLTKEYQALMRACREFAYSRQEFYMNQPQVTAPAEPEPTMKTHHREIATESPVDIDTAEKGREPEEGEEKEKEEEKKRKGNE